MGTAILGKVRSTPRGAYNSSLVYEIMDRVYVAGKTYEALKHVPAGTPVTNTNYWVLMADNDVALQDIIERTTNLENNVTSIQGSVGSVSGLAQLNASKELVETQVPANIRNHVTNTDIHVTLVDKEKLNQTYNFITGDTIQNMIDSAFSFEEVIVDKVENPESIPEGTDPENKPSGDGYDNDGGADINTEETE